MGKTRILFIGGTKRGFCVLKALLEQSENIVGIFAMIEDLHEIAKYSSEIEKLAIKNNIPIKLVKKIDTKCEEEITKKLLPDLILVVGWRTVIPCSVYNYPKFGCLGVHDSLLPQYRGFAPTNWTIINGDKVTGVTLMMIGDGIDEGDIVSQNKVTISDDDTVASLYEKIIDATINIVLKNLPDLKTGNYKRYNQNNKDSSYGCSRIPDDGYIDWSKKTKDIYNLIRGLTYPYPGAFTWYKGKKLIIWKGKIIKNPPKYSGRIPGRVIKICKGVGVEVLTGDGIILIEDVQFEDGNRVNATEVFNSVKVSLGLNMVEIEERIRRIERVLK